MIGRITTLMTSAQILQDINNAQDQLNTTQEELSTGRTINQPSDNPYGASLAVQLNQNLAGLSQYSNQITDGNAWTQAASTGLTSIQNAVQRVQELVVSASNGTLSASQLADTGDEVSQLQQEIMQVADTKYNGQNVFAGGTTTAGQTYGGTPGQTVTRQIGPGSSVQVNTDLGALLGNGSGDGGLLDTLNSIVTQLNAGSSAGVSGLSNALQANLNTLEGIQANVGSAQDRLTQASTTIQALQTNDATALSNDQDANMAATMTTFSSQQAAFEAALQAGANIVQTSLMNFLSTS